ncbi:armadillo-type protein [Phyllosticta capitalensis]
MAAMSRGKDAKAKAVKQKKKEHRKKGGTESSRHHHYESFSQRVAKLTIDPVRRTRRHFDDEDLSASTSYLKNSFEEWKDLNLSQDFQNFCRELTPLCESLPQILHYEDRIMDLLVAYIEKENELSLEPLLSLVSHFAHDLGARFEKHFGRTVQLLCRIASKHQAIEAIEWSFTCMAWLFKYLSRLLVADLRPLYDLMAPMLGKEHRKHFVTRFAAEAMSFLVRKAGASYHRDREPLRIFVAHAIRDLEEMAQREDTYQYQQGLMSLFVESVKGVQNGLHSSGQAVFKELMTQAMAPENVNADSLVPDESPAMDVLQGVLTAIIHHTTSHTFKPILEVMLETIQESVSKLSKAGLQNAARLLLTAAGVRKGTRIEDWNAISKTITEVVTCAESQDLSQDSGLASETLVALAVILQVCPMDIAIPHLRILDRISSGPWQEHFLVFCNFFAELGTERFQSLLLPHFKRFITSRWNDNAEQLNLLIPRLAGRGCFSNSPSLVCPTAWQESIISSFKNLSQPSEEPLADDAANSNGFLDIMRTMSVEDHTEKTVYDELYQLLLASLGRASQDMSPQYLFGAGAGFKYVAEHQSQQRQSNKIWEALAQSSEILMHYPIFAESTLKYLKTNEKDFNVQGKHLDTLIDSVVESLGSPSHDLRTSGLDILQRIYKAKHDGEESEILSIAILIESMPLNIETARNVSMNIRRLAMAYKNNSSDPLLARAIPTYCFGLLYVNFTQVWEDSCNALKEICEIKEGEDVVSSLAFKWIEAVPALEVSEAESSDESKSSIIANEFECTNLIRLTTLATETTELLANATEKLHSKFLLDHKRVEYITTSSRSQALRVLASIPQVAEKKSRQLVPILLKWAVGAERLDAVPSEESESAAERVSEQQRWVRKDQKALLSIFAKFNNPKVLYKSADVYSSLLMLLGNGDVEIQKSALKAIFTWKNQSINRYEENLMNLLDDARFREQISVFLDTDQEDAEMQEEDRTDLMPVILRMLYGKVIARAGASSGKRGQESRRKAVFIALFKFGDNEIRQFLDIALGSLSGLSLVNRDVLNEEEISKELLDSRKHFGLLNMLEDMLDTLGTQLAPFTGQLIDPVLYCLIKASRGITAIQTEQKEASGLSLLTSIRQVGFHCLNALFTYCPEFPTWNAYIPSILSELVEPRLEKLAVETAQSPSGILRLFSAWSKSEKTVAFLVKFNRDLVDNVASCLEVSFAKEEVKLFVLRDILQNVIAITEGDAMDVDQPTESSPAFVQKEILGPKSGRLLGAIGGELQKSPSKELLDVGVQTVSRLAPFIDGSAECKSIVDIALFLLQQPTRRVSPRTKSDLLNILHHFVPQVSPSKDDELLRRIFENASSLFGYFQDRRSRELLAAILGDLAQSDSDLVEVAQLASDLNAFAPNRLDEPDFDRRSKAFHCINEELYNSLSVKQWLPVVYNMLFYIKEQEELVLRMNSSYGLRRFVEAAANEDNSENEAFQKLITSAIIPGVQNGVREKSELVRTEYLSVLAHIVRSFPSWPVVSDMHVLLVDDDDEASFFSNILHIQQHRRLRALRRLASEASKLLSANICHIFIPLIEHFIFDKADDDSGASNLAGEATTAIGALALSLDWPQYRAVLRRYSQLEMEKSTIKLLGTVIDALQKAAQAKGLISASQTIEGDDEEMADAGSDEAVQTTKAALPVLARSMPRQDKLSDDLVKNLIPPLTAFIHHKDDSTVSLRVPVAIIIVKLLRLLRREEFVDRLPPVLMDVCAILRSRDQQARDMTRKTLAEISALIGPEYFGFLLKALRTALQRGYQLHVLSFTVHSILVSMTPTFKPGQLDYCLNDIVSVVMDDIFGVTGQEKDAEEYISKMKEVKSSKSFDSIELIAKTTTIPRFIDLLSPVRTLLLEKLDLKMVKKIDELLRRLGLGIMHNGAIHDRQILVFCYQLIQDVYKSKDAAANSRNDVEDPRTKRYLINMKYANKDPSRGKTTSHIHKLIRFSLDVLRAVLNKHDQLATPTNLAGFMPIIGDAIVSGQEEIQMSAVRLLGSIVKVPLERIEKDAPIYVAEAVRIIKGERDTNTELAQACLKLISAILREKKTVSVRNNDVAYILKRIKDDLEEPDRQGVSFNFLKAVIGRKIIIAEVYEILDTVSTVMVTNQTRTARDLARGVYFQFLMEYPQTKDRLAKQMAFLVKNLDYKHKEGRQSVMEAIHLLLSKVGDELVQEVAENVFAPLVLRLVNDDDKDCREMAGLLIKKVFERADADRSKRFTDMLRAWIEQDDVALKRRLGIQCYTLYLDVHEENRPKDTKYLLKQLPGIMEEAQEQEDEADWELLYYSLQCFAKICQVSPTAAFSADKQEVWSLVKKCLFFPHAWVKLTAAKLIGLYFSDFASFNKDNGLQSVPLVGSNGLELTGADMLELLRAHMRMLRVPGISEELATQIVRNVVFLGRCFGANSLPYQPVAQSNGAQNGGGDEDAESSASEAEEEADAEATEIAKKTTTTSSSSSPTALSHLLHRLSQLLRRQPPAIQGQARTGASLVPKQAALTLLAALLSHLAPETYEPQLPLLLHPLHVLTDPSAPQPAASNSHSLTTSAADSYAEAHKALVASASEVLALVQKKVGAGVFVKVMGVVREGVVSRREGRRAKRRVEAVAEPERALQKKRRRHERERERKKEKGWDERGKRRGW